MKLDFICVATLGIDIISTGEDTFKFGGGSGVNTACILQKLGLKTGIVGRVGKDAHGKEIIRDLKNLGVDINGVVIDNHPTPVCHISLKAGERTIVRFDYLKRLNTFKREHKGYIKSAKVVLLSPRFPPFDRYLPFATKNKIDVYLSLHGSTINEKQFSLLKKYKPRAIFANEKEVKRNSFIFDLNIPILVTKGKNGCTFYLNKKKKPYPSFKVKPVDTTGAGDGFAAGYIFGNLKKWNTDKKITFASALGALTALQIGARSRLYSLEEVQNFIASTNIYTY